MHRFVCVVVPFVLVLHAMTSLATLDLSQCEKMTGLTNDTANEIERGFLNGTIEWNDTRIKPEICFKACYKSLKPNGQWHQNGTANVAGWEADLREKQARPDYDPAESESDNLVVEFVRGCANVTLGRDFCDTVLKVVECSDKASEDFFAAYEAGLSEATSTPATVTVSTVAS